MKARFLTRTAILVAITLTVQALGLAPQVRGPAFNALLLLGSIFVGPPAGVVLGLLTPWLALSRGILSPVLAPAVPFLMLGNIVYVLVFTKICPWAGRYMALFAGAVGKYLVLAGAVTFLLQLPRPVAASLGVPELFTALLGGAVALVIAQLLVGIYADPKLSLVKGVRSPWK